MSALEESTPKSLKRVSSGGQGHIPSSSFSAAAQRFQTVDGDETVRRDEVAGSLFENESTCWCLLWDRVYVARRSCRERRCYECAFSATFESSLRLLLLLFFLAYGTVAALLMNPLAA